MRLLILPAAFLLGAALYAIFPQARGLLPAALRVLLEKIRRLFTSKAGKTDERSALAVYFLLIAAAAVLLCAVHPVLCALIMAPLFPGFASLPAAVNTKQELDSGAFSKDIPEYERRVLAACAPLGGVFARGVCTPLLLCALGMALHLGGAPGYLYMGLLAVREALPAAGKFLKPAEKAGDAAFCALLLLCCGLVGRNPLRVSGSGADEKLMNVLSLDGDADHAPISGDITQAVFLCCLCASLLCALCCAAGLFAF